MFFVENLEAKLLCWNICRKLKAKVNEGNTAGPLSFAFCPFLLNRLILFLKSLTTGKTWRNQVEREVGGGIGMGNIGNSMSDSCQCMTKPTEMLRSNKPLTNKNK